MIKCLRRYSLKKSLVNFRSFNDVVEPCDKLPYKSSHSGFDGLRRFLNNTHQLTLTCTVAKALIGHEMADTGLQGTVKTSSNTGVQDTGATDMSYPVVQDTGTTDMSYPGVQGTGTTDMSDPVVRDTGVTAMSDPEVQETSPTAISDPAGQDISASVKSDQGVQETGAAEMSDIRLQETDLTEMSETVVQETDIPEMSDTGLQEIDLTALSDTGKENGATKMFIPGLQETDLIKMSASGSRETDVTSICSGICDRETVTEDMDISGANDTAVVLLHSQETADSKNNDYDLSDLFSGELERRRKKEATKLVMKNKRFKRSHKNSDNTGSDNEQNDSSERKKKRPNYFIALQINNAKIKSALQDVQDAIVSKEKRLASAVTSVRKLHITLMVMCLETEEEMQKSKMALDNAAQKLVPIHSVSPLTLSMSGLGDFKGQVVFAKVKDDNQLTSLTNIAEVVEESFLDQQIVSTDRRGFKPHVTVMKMSQMKAWQKKGLKKIDNALYEEFEKCDFGSDTINTLQLCAMGQPVDKHGYYHVDHSALFDRVGIPPEKKYVIPALRPRKKSSEV